MKANDEALASILSTKAAVALLPRSRKASVIATKLDEAELWARSLLGPEAIHYLANGDVLTAAPRHATIRIELIDGRAECSVRVDGHAPIEFSVTKPHDRTLVTEASEVSAAVYWSRSRSIEGSTPGEVTVT